jgi:DNA-directed RNA polymerase specialized sigma24 family protein
VSADDKIAEIMKHRDVIAFAALHAGADYREIDDLVHEVLVIAFAHVRAGKPLDLGEVRGWLFIVTVRLVRSRRRGAPHEEPYEEVGHAPAAPDPMPAFDDFREAFAILGRMTAEEERIADALVRTETAADAARLLGWKQGTFFSRLRAMRARLAQVRRFMR